MPLPPLTHHDIVGLVEPFSRQGRHVDLAASDRQNRRLVFKPQAGAEPALDGMLETLQLECLNSGWHRLTRVLTRADGVQARAQAQGRDLASLLAQVNAVPHQRHFSSGPGYLIARSYTLDPGEAPTLSIGTLFVDGLQVTLDVPALRKIAAEVTLSPALPGSMQLPEDLLAVLGWNWARLVPNRQGWTSKLRLRSRGAQRTRHAEAALERAASHLVQTLAGPLGRVLQARYSDAERHRPVDLDGHPGALRYQPITRAVDDFLPRAHGAGGDQLLHARAGAVRDSALAAPVAIAGVAAGRGLACAGRRLSS